VSAAETWLLASAILAGIGALFYLAPLSEPRPHWWGGVAPALVALAVGAMAVALAVSPL
jgi:hypothetical protein